jgi:hypothetical protein
MRESFIEVEQSGTLAYVTCWAGGKHPIWVKCKNKSAAIDRAALETIGVASAWLASRIIRRVIPSHAESRWSDSIRGYLK